MSDDAEPANTEPITWDKTGESYDRTQNAGIIVTRTGRYRWDVALTDTQTTHSVTLAQEWHGYVGTCDCDGVRYHGVPCAHLWGLRLAEQHGIATIDPVTDAIDEPAKCPTCGRDAPEGAYGEQ